ncbi:hypothetical protein Tco_1238225 [Tanacetum coccineum]
MYAEVFGIDVPLTQSQPTESTHKTYRTTSAPRSPNPDKEVAESSAPRRSTVIRLRIPERRSIRLTPPALVPTIDKADEMILQDTLHVSLAEHKSREEQEARKNVALVDEHLVSKEIEKMVDGQENIPKPTRFNATRVFFQSYKDFMLLVCTSTERCHVKKDILYTYADNSHVCGGKGLILERAKAKEETERLISKSYSAGTSGNIQKQKEPGKPKEEIYLNSKIVQEHQDKLGIVGQNQVITEMLARRAKLLQYTGLLWSLSVFIRSTVTWERVHDFQLRIESYQQKYGYVQKDLTKEEAEYLKLFEEEIEERLKHRRQMRRWDMSVNGRPLRPRKERPE